jgi:hypothetical protein
MVTGPSFGDNRINRLTPIQKPVAFNGVNSLNGANSPGSVFSNAAVDSFQFSGAGKAKAPNLTHNVDFGAISKLDLGHSLDQFQNPTTSQGLLFGSFNA